MRTRNLLCALVFGATLMGQTAADRNLTATLMAMKNIGGSRATLAPRLADNLLALANPDQQPSRTTVMVFADQLTDALIGNQVAFANVVQTQRCVSGVMRGSRSNLQWASELRDFLKIFGVEPTKIHAITKSFIAVGEEIRGPDDMRLGQPKVALPQK
jgi:hypothetical protein